MKYDKEGITVPKKVSNKTKSCRNDNDIVGQWISQACQEVDNKVEPNGYKDCSMLLR